MASATSSRPQLWAADTSKGHDSLIDPSIAESDIVNTHLKPLEIQLQAPQRRPHRRYIKLIIICFLVIVLAAPWIKMSILISRGEDEPNPPLLPESMLVFYPPQNEHEMHEMQTLLNKYSDPILTWDEFIHSSNGNEVPNHQEFTHTSADHFSDKRTALLFTPGVYPLDIEIGYYTSLYGLGVHPDDVTFIGSKGPHVPSLDKFTDRPPNGSGLNSFWRSIENIATKPQSEMTWAVSQAAPLRRIHVHGDLNLFDADAWVSGGFGSNLVVDGSINFGGQQQWILRNANVNGISGGAWNLVFVGCMGNIPGETTSLEAGGPLVSVEDKPRVSLEKPYIVLKDQQIDDRINQVPRFELRVPKVMRRKDAIIAQFHEDVEIRDFCRVKLVVPSVSLDVAMAATENHSKIQKALDHGKDIVFSPGIYYLSSSLKIKHPNQVLLGLGYATLIAPTNGSPCIHVLNNVPGVRIAGIMLEASVLTEEQKTKNSCLLQWGDNGIVDDGDASNPGLLSDVFARVGGSSFDRNVSTETMIVLHSGNIVGDNIWLWRADHVALKPKEKPNFPQISPLYRQTTSGECEVKNGLVVNGDNITIFGLAVEHTTEDQVIWSGEDGEVHFYQSELPYDTDQSYSLNEYVGYRVNQEIKKHRAQGVGIYSNFRDHAVNVTTAILIPEQESVTIKNIFTVKLDNKGKINSIVNGRGPGPTDDMSRGLPLKCLDNNSCA